MVTRRIVEVGAARAGDRSGASAKFARPGTAAPAVASEKGIDGVVTNAKTGAPVRGAW
ncbi:hypothetical protein [Amycolatopsis sp. NPDC050768]|uniref:hypothetical protein n=1 Tax=Amycolatopsis sp. NPDC050768 TaxID=3154839 RepID=UPI0033C685A1